MATIVPFGLYDVDRYYLDELRKADPHVPKSDYEDDGQHRKFYCGPVYNDKGINYFVPISSKIKKQDYLEPYVRIMKNPENKKEIGCLDFRYMVPVPSKYIAPHEDMDAEKRNSNGELSHTAIYARICNNAKARKKIHETAKAAFNDISDNKPIAKSSIAFGKMQRVVRQVDRDITQGKSSYKPDPFVTDLRTRFQNTIEGWSTPAVSTPPDITPEIK